MALAFSRACANTGNRIAARIAIIAIKTNSSMSVKQRLRMESSVNNADGTFSVTRKKKLCDS